MASFHEKAVVAGYDPARNDASIAGVSGRVKALPYQFVNAETYVSVIPTKGSAWRDLRTDLTRILIGVQ